MLNTKFSFTIFLFVAFSGFCIYMCTLTAMISHCERHQISTDSCMRFYRLQNVAQIVISTGVDLKLAALSLLH